MPWLADSDVGAAYGLARGLAGARTEAEFRGRALDALAELVPADVVIYDRVHLATGHVRHEAVPAEAERPGTFDAVVRHASDHPLLAAHMRHAGAPLCGCRSSCSHERSPTALSVRRPASRRRSGVRDRDRRSHRSRRGRRRRPRPHRARFSERDRDVLDITAPRIEGELRATQARGRLVRALAADPPPGTAVVLLNRDGEIELSSVEAELWLAEHFGPAEHPGWLPGPVTEWLALPPRPPLVDDRDGRRLTVCLLPGDPHALLLEEQIASFRSDALERLGLTPRETEVLRAAAVIDDEAEIAWELFLSLHAVRELARVEAKLGVRTATDAVARALGESA
jgi:DNA-binding CsgD family transcriptional regulator